jgi:serine phosphatase RsbU (regulator of sigma subunit)/tetratricopeptide (TPR) repeat protein
VKEKNNLNLMQKYFVLVWLIFFINLNALAQDKESESIKLKLQTATQKEKVSLYLKLSDLAESYDERIGYCERAINIANELKDIELQANANFTIGIYYYTEGKYIDAERCFLESLGYYKKRNDTKSVAKTYYWLATTCRYWGKFYNAVKYAKLGLDLSERLKWAEGIIDATLVTGNIYQAWGDQEQAEIYFTKVLDKLKGREENLSFGFALQGKGNVLFSRGEIDSAKIFYEKSQKVFINIKSKFGHAMALKEISRYYIFKKDYKKAESNLIQALSLVKEIKNKRGLYEVYILEGDLYLKKGNFSRAVELYLAGQNLANQMGLSDEIAENYKTISKLYESKKDNTKALKYFKLYSNFKDSATSLSSSERITEIITTTDAEKKEKESQNLKKENELKKSETSRSYILISAIVIVLILLVSLVFIVLKEFKLRQHHLKTSEEQKAELNSLQFQLNSNFDYADKIQSSIMPDNAALTIPHFIMFRPNERVGGDFYWFKQIENQLVVAVADCTGHGISGAFMSSLGISFLNYLFIGRKELSCAQILEELRTKVKMSLKQDIFDNKVIDVIEMAICIININTLEMQYAGAKHPLYLISNGELKILEASNNPLGAYLKEKPFENQQVQLKKGDNIYMFSNGYMDQFGGKEGKKFKSTHFRDALLAICESDMETQKHLLEKIFDEWKNSKYDQTDDVLVLGMKI